jgi:beta-N-acetylhexosaminidase
MLIERIIRGRIDFQGLLLSDDIDMKALQFAMNGGLGRRAEAALEAGCDVVLQSSGALKDMAEVANACRALTGVPLVRARAVEAFAKRPADEFDAEAGWVRYKRLMGGVLAA